MAQIKIFLLAVLVTFGVMTGGATAQTTITSDGSMDITGEITATGLNSFTIQSNEGTMEVTLARLNDRSIQNLRSAGILARGNVVEVSGKLERSTIKSVIAADMVRIYNPSDTPVIP